MHAIDPFIIVAVLIGFATVAGWLGGQMGANRTRKLIAEKDWKIGNLQRVLELVTEKRDEYMEKYHHVDDAAMQERGELKELLAKALAERDDERQKRQGAEQLIKTLTTPQAIDAFVKMCVDTENPDVKKLMARFRHVLGLETKALEDRVKYQNVKIHELENSLLVAGTKLTFSNSFRSEGP